MIKISVFLKSVEISIKVSKESFPKFKKASQSFKSFKKTQEKMKTKKTTSTARRIISDKKCMTLCVKSTMRAYECVITKEYHIIVIESISTLNYKHS